VANDKNFKVKEGLDVGGNINLNTDVNPTITIKNTDTSIVADQAITTLEFRGADDSGNVLAGQIQQVASGEWGVADYGSDMIFSVKQGGTFGAFAEKLRLQYGGVGVSGDLAVSGGTTGTTADFSSSVEANNFSISGGAFIARNPGNNNGSLWLAADVAGTAATNTVTIAGGVTAYAAFNGDGIAVSGTITATGYNDTNWNTAYTYSQVSHLPLSGGTLTGNLALNTDVNPTITIKNTDTSIIADQVITTLEFRGADDSGNVLAGQIQQVASASWGTGSYDSDMVFSTKTGGTGGPFTEKLRLQVGGVGVSGDLAVSGTITATGGTSTNWNTAYGWGNHASVGYFLASNYTNVFKSGSEIAGSQDLDTYRTTGYYSQDSNADAISGSNYPVLAAGILEVITGDQGNGLQTEQRYSQYNTNVKYVRHYYNGTWTAWAGQWNSSNDGSGSGLDADLLDGEHGSYYASNFSLGNYLPLSGGTLTGDLLTNHASATPIQITRSTGTNINIKYSSSSGTTYVGQGATAGTLRVGTTADLIGTGNEVWHYGNLPTSSVSNWNTAYGWGDHSTVGYAIGSFLPLAGGTLTGTLNGTTADFSSSVEANNFNIVGGAFIARNPGNIDGSLWLASDASGTTSANGVTLAGGTSAYSYHNSDGINIKQGGLLIDDVEVISASSIINAKSLYLNGTGGGRVPHPEGATYFTGVSAHTGACKIKLPTASKGKSDMISFEVSIYDYAANESVKLLINAYQYSDVNWTNHTVITLAGQTGKDYVVRFGSDATSHCVWIGELTSTWNFPQVSVDNFKCGFAATPSDYADGWEISFASAFDTVQDTISTSLPVAQFSQDSDKLNGQLASYYATTSSLGNYLPLSGGTLTGDLLMDSADAEINLKAGAAGTSGAVNWTFNTTDTNYASISLPYDTRATTGLHIDSGYPITLDATTSMRFDISGSEKMRLFSNGNLSIGTISSLGKLTVSNGGAEGIEFFPANITGGNTTQHYDRTGLTYLINNVIASEHRFNIGASQAVTIDTTGNVGIGINAPSSKLHVAGHISQSSGSIYAFGNVEAGLGHVKASTGYLMGTTTVIDSSRNLTNIVNISSSTNGRNSTGGNITLGREDASTTKESSIVSRQYSSQTETEGFTMMGSYADINTQYLFIGGGLAEQNSASTISLYTSVSGTTERTGTERVRVSISGLDIRSGDLKINGTTAIDSSRNISAGTINTTGNITAGNSVYLGNTTTTFLDTGPYSSTNMSLNCTSAIFLYSGSTQMAYFSSTNAWFNKRTVIDGGTTLTAATPNIRSIAESQDNGVTQYHIHFENSVGAVHGRITTNNFSTTYATTSDYRVKEDVQPMVSATERLLQLNPVNFKWKESDVRTDGFLAHEVDEIVPEAVVGEKDATEVRVDTVENEDGTTTEVESTVDSLQALDQAKLIPLLVKTVQEQQALIASLEERLCALETQ